MQRTISGKAFVYGANVDTDQIYPGRFLDMTDIEDVAKHAMEGIDPDFASAVEPGDIVVAATNFGCGSSREHAAVTLKHAGVGAVLAESFGRIFYRNGTNLGLPLLVCRGLHAIVKKGDRLTIDLSKSTVTNDTAGKTLMLEPVSDYAMKILAAGGIKLLVKEEACH